MKRWFYRLTAVHFLVTAATGLVLYFRPGGARPGLFSDEVKEWLVMIHNGEWLSYVLVGKPFYSGIVVGGLLALALFLNSARALRRQRRGSAASAPS